MHATNFNSPLLPTSTTAHSNNQFSEIQNNYPISFKTLRSSNSSTMSSDSSITTYASIINNGKQKDKSNKSISCVKKEVFSIKNFLESGSIAQNSYLINKIYSENKAKAEPNTKSCLKTQIVITENELNMDNTLKENPQLLQFITRRQLEINRIKSEINQKYKLLKNDWIRKLLKNKDLSNSNNKKLLIEDKQDVQEKDNLIVEKFLSLSKQQTLKFYKGAADIPEYNFDMLDRLFKQFNNNNMLVRDPVKHYKEDDLWNRQQKKLFVQNYLKYPKQFGKIASFIDGKNSQQCVLFYYKNKKDLNLKNRLIGLKRSEFIRKHQNVLSTEKKLTNKEKIPKNSKGSALLYSIEISTKKNKQDNTNKPSKKTELKRKNKKEESPSNLSILLSPADEEKSANTSFEPKNAFDTETLNESLISQYSETYCLKQNCINESPLPSKNNNIKEPSALNEKYQRRSKKTTDSEKPKSDSEVFIKTESKFEHSKVSPSGGAHNLKINKTPEKTKKEPCFKISRSESRLDHSKYPASVDNNKEYMAVKSSSERGCLLDTSEITNVQKGDTCEGHYFEKSTKADEKKVSQVVSILNDTPYDTVEIPPVDLTTANTELHNEKDTDKPEIEEENTQSQKRKSNKDYQLDSILQPTYEKCAYTQEKKQKTTPNAKSAATITNLLTTSVEVENSKWSKQDIFKWFENS